MPARLAACKDDAAQSSTVSKAQSGLIISTLVVPALPTLSMRYGDARHGEGRRLTRSQFANLNVTSTASLYHAHLTHPMPVTRGADMYAPRDLPSFPFATMFSWSLEECVPQLVGLLPARDELFGYLESFQRRAYVCFFPHIPPEITASEVDRFLSDREKNTEKCPDMLALLFAALALGWQHSIWDKARGEWEADTTKEARGGDVFSEPFAPSNSFSV